MVSARHRLDQAGRFVRDAAESLFAAGRASAAPLAGRMLAEEADGRLTMTPTSELVEAPRIALDGVFFQLQTTGIARLWHALMREWSASGFARHISVLDREHTTPRLPGFTYHAIPPLLYHDSAPARLALERFCRAEQADLLLSTYYTTPASTPSVMYVYDMIPEVLGFDLNAPMWREKRRAIEHASAFVAISHATAADLTRFYPVAAAKPLLVAPCAADALFSPATPEQVAALRGDFDLPERYVVFVGARDAEQKNARLAFEALALIPASERPALLCVGGSATLEPELAKLLADSPVRVAALGDEELRAAYSGALALAYPSRYEGFGLPLLEAMACGCPTVTCEASAMPEVAGDAALYVSAKEPRELADAIVRLRDDAAMRADLRERGLRRAATFSWRETAEQVAAFVSAIARGETASPVPPATGR